MSVFGQKKLQPNYNQKMQYLRFMRNLPVAKFRNCGYLQNNEDFEEFSKSATLSN